MRRFRSRFPERSAIVAGLVVAAITTAWTSRANAQACCAGASAVAPSRLQVQDDAVVGAQLKATRLLGSWSPTGTYTANPPGTGESDFEEDLFATVRLHRFIEATVLVPFVETSIANTQASGFGGGVGDLAVSARFTLLRTGASARFPGLALIAGVVAPTGKPVGASNGDALGVDVTGQGSWQGVGGVSIERVEGAWFFALNGTVALRASYTVGSDAAQTTTRLAPRFTVSASSAYSVAMETAISFTILAAFEGDATVDGASSPASNRRLTQLIVGAVTSFSDQWRGQASVYCAPPLSSLGVNDFPTIGAAIVLLRSFS